MTIRFKLLIHKCFPNSPALVGEPVKSEVESFSDAHDSLGLVINDECADDPVRASLTSKHSGLLALEVLRDPSSDEWAEDLQELREARSIDEWADPKTGQLA